MMPIPWRTKVAGVLFPRSFCLLLIPLALVACREDKAPTSAASVSVLVAPAAPANAAAPTEYSGEVRARHEADLGFRVAGKIAARLVDVGATVAAGQTLARLDPTDLQLNVAAVRAQVSAAESDLALAKADVERYKALAEQKFVSQAVLDAKHTAYQAAGARAEQARAQLNVSSNQAGYAGLTSDRTGVVTAVLAEAGQVVAAGQPVLRVARPEEKEILIYVPEGALAALRAARAFSVGLPASPQVKLRGALRELAPAADPATRTYAARIRLLDSDPALQLGMTARVALAGASAQDGVRVPLGAVLERGQGPEVWVVVQGKAQRRPVKVAEFREDGVLLASGVALGEPVVAVGAHKLVAGMAVKPLPMPEK